MCAALLYRLACLLRSCNKWQRPAPTELSELCRSLYLGGILDCEVLSAVIPCMNVDCEGREEKAEDDL